MAAGLSQFRLNEASFYAPLIIKNKGQMNANASHGSTASLSTDGPRVALVSVLLLIDLSNVVGNLMVFVIVLATRRLQTITNYFIMSLCATDLLAGLLLIPFAVDAILNETSFARVNDAVCDFLGFVDSIYAITSSLNIAAIAMDRYQAIVHCLHYEALVTQRKAGMVIAWIWLQAVLISIGPLVGWGKFSFRTHQYICALHFPDEDGFIFVQVTSCIVLPYIIMVFCYARIHHVARRQARSIRVHIQVQDSQRRVVGISTQKTRQVYVVIGLYTLSWFPLFAIKLAQSISPGISIPGLVTTLATVLTFISGTYNPVLYALRTSQFRAGIFRLYRTLRRQFAPNRVGQSGGETTLTISGRSRSRSASNIFQYRLASQEAVGQGVLPIALAVHSDLKPASDEDARLASSTSNYPMTLQIPDRRRSKGAKANQFPLPPLSSNLMNGLTRGFITQRE